jgi:hypothetical protein
MNTLSTLLRDADPLRHEPPRDVHARRVRRQAVLGARRVMEQPRRSMMPAVAVVVLTLASSVALPLWFSAPGVADLQAAVRFEVRLAETAFTPGLREVALDATRRIYVHDDVVVSNSDVEHAEVARDAGATFSVVVAFTAAGAAKMRRATSDHIGRPLALLIDGKVIAAPTVRATIGESAVLNGLFSKSEADRIAGGLLGR